MSNSNVTLNNALVIQVLNPAFSRLSAEYRYTVAAKYNVIKHFTGNQEFMNGKAFFFFYTGKKKSREMQLL
jgi:hypothetical protein